MKKTKKELYLPQKKRRKRRRGRKSNVFYSTEGMELWNWTLTGIRRAVPSPLDTIRICLLVLTTITIGLILFLKSPMLWLVMGAFAIMALMIRTLTRMYIDMKRERNRARALVRKERARTQAVMRKEREIFCNVIDAMGRELEKVETMNKLLWQIQQETEKADAPKTLIVQYTNNYLYFEGMNFFGNVNTNGGSIYGDNAVHNETHNHFGNEQETKVNTEGFTPYVNLLRQMIDPVRESGDWKAILCPYRAAVTEGVLPKWPHKTFVSLMRVQVPASCYSDWMKDCSYTTGDLEPYSEQFKRLKLEIDNPE